MGNRWRLNNETRMQVLEMDAKIRDEAIRGSTDSDLNGAIDIYWKKIGDRIAVYIEFLETEEGDTMQYGYRIFDKADDFEKKLSVIPSYETDMYNCIYDHVESETGETTSLYTNIFPVKWII